MNVTDRTSSNTRVTDIRPYKIEKQLFDLLYVMKWYNLSKHSG